MLPKELVLHRENQVQQKPANEQTKNTMRDQLSTKANFQDFQGQHPPGCKGFSAPSIFVFKMTINMTLKCSKGSTSRQMHFTPPFTLPSPLLKKMIILLKPPKLIYILWWSVKLTYHRFIQKLLDLHRCNNTMVYYKAWQVFCHFTNTLWKRNQPQNYYTTLHSWGNDLRFHVYHSRIRTDDEEVRAVNASCKP